MAAQVAPKKESAEQFKLRLRKTAMPIPEGAMRKILASIKARAQSIYERDVSRLGGLPQSPPRSGRLGKFLSRPTICSSNRTASEQGRLGSRQAKPLAEFRKLVVATPA